MVLEGEIALTHQGHYNIFLKPFEQDTFKGDWKSESKGCVTDFNLMTQDNGMGYLDHIVVSRDDVLDIILKTPFPENDLPLVTEVYYVFRGEISVVVSDHTYHLELGDVILITNSEKENHRLLCVENRSGCQADLVRSVIYHK